MHEAQGIGRDRPVEYPFVQGADRGWLTIQRRNAVDHDALFEGGGPVDELGVVQFHQDLLQVAYALAFAGPKARQHEAVERQYGRLLHGGVDQQREHAIPGAGSASPTHLGPEPERRRVPVMAVGDQDRPVSDPAPDRRPPVELPHPMRHSLLVGGRSEGFTTVHLVQEPIELLDRPLDRAVHGREVRVGRPHQTEPVLDRAGHRPFVREDGPPGLLEL